MKVELIKLHRSSIWLAFIFIPIIPAIMGTYNYIQNIEILQDKWYSLWTQHTLFTCYFFMPAIIGIYCSYLMRLEHANHNWNTVMTSPVPVGLIFVSKLLIVTIILVLTHVWIGLLFIVSGRLAGLTGPLPLKLVEWLVSGLLGGMAICALQLFLSLIIRSFAVPVAAAFAGGIIGLMAFARGLGAWLPFSLYSIGMRANNPDGVLACNAEQLVINSVLYIAVFSIAAVLWMRNRDVVTG